MQSEGGWVRTEADADAVGANLGDHSVYHLQHQPRPVLQAAPVLVRPLVGLGLQETFQEVSARGTRENVALRPNPPTKSQPQCTPCWKGLLRTPAFLMLRG